MNDLLTAIYERLTNVITDINIYTFVPQDNVEYPFIQINNPLVSVNDTDTIEGLIVNINIVTRTNYKGIKEVGVVADRVNGALHRHNLGNTAEWAIGVMFEVGREYATDDNGLVRAIAQRFVARIDKIN